MKYRRGSVIVSKAYILLLSCGAEELISGVKCPHVYADYTCKHCGKRVYIKDIIEVIGKRALENVLCGKRPLKRCK